jgi:DNA-directed RNA polymerase specialized sigma24 family protein
MADQHADPRARGDEAELFRAYNDQLMRAVAQATFATSPQIVEDACSFASTKFMENQPERDRNWRGWLFRVAQHEVWVLDRAAREHVPVRSGTPSGEPFRGVEPAAPNDPFDTWIELDDAPLDTP